MVDKTAKRQKSSKEIDVFEEDSSVHDSGSSSTSTSNEITEFNSDPVPAEIVVVDQSDHPVDDEMEELEEEEEMGLEEEETAIEEEEAAIEQEERVRKKKKDRPPVKKGVLEYDLWDMYPEISLLTQKTKKEWNYSDAEIIRALWLEAKTNALREWKYKHAKISIKKKPSLPIQPNNLVQLRKEYREQKKERAKEIKQRDLAMTYIGRDAPDFKELQLPTTLTAQLRYKFHRDDPPVPEFYLQHFEKFRKPPFKTKINVNRSCKP